MGAYLLRVLGSGDRPIARATHPPNRQMQAYVWRWNIEVTFDEVRACLGFETPRDWSAPHLADHFGASRLEAACYAA